MNSASTVSAAVQARDEQRQALDGGENGAALVNLAAEDGANPGSPGTAAFGLKQVEELRRKKRLHRAISIVATVLIAMCFLIVGIMLALHSDISNGTQRRFNFTYYYLSSSAQSAGATTPAMATASNYSLSD